MNDDFLPFLIFAAAVLYSAVGHAGASGYLAAMAFVGVAPDAMKPSALVLNILVASIGTVRFFRAGCFSWSLFLPFALGSVPLAFIGGVITLPGTLYKQAVGAVLMFAAVRLFFPSNTATESKRRRPTFTVAILCGAVIGLLSGLTGTGGGIFLTPLLLFMGWAETKQSAGVSVAFILVNSIAALIGHFATINSPPVEMPLWALAAVTGGIVGSELGSRRLGNMALRRLLAVVLVIAGGKLMLV